MRTRKLIIWFPCEMTPDEQEQKLPTYDGSLPRSGDCFWIVMPQGKFASTNEKHYLDRGGETSSAPNVHSHSSHISRAFQQPAVISQELYDLGKCWGRIPWLSLISRFIADLPKHYPNTYNKCSYPIILPNKTTYSNVKQTLQLYFYSVWTIYIVFNTC